MHPRRWWEIDIATRGWQVAPRGRAAYRWGRPAPHGSVSPFASVWSPLEFSRTFPRSSRGRIPRFHLTCRSALMVFRLNPAEITYSPKFMKFISLNPKPLLVISFMPLYMFYWQFIMVVNYYQQATTRRPERPLTRHCNGADGLRHGWTSAQDWHEWLPGGSSPSLSSAGRRLLAVLCNSCFRPAAYKHRRAAASSELVAEPPDVTRC
jgi:hypothetical protein